MARSIGRAAVDLGRVLSAEGTATVGTASTVGVHDDLPTGQTGVPVRPPDDKLAGRVHVQFVVAFEQGLDTLRTIREHPRQHDVRHIVLDPGEHRGFIRVKVVVLRGQHHRLHPEGRVVISVFNGDLALAVRPQVGHLVSLAAARRARARDGGSSPAAMA